ncbi:MAG: putative lipid II flippase FtsW [Desulfobacteraceae bacterium]
MAGKGRAAKGTDYGILVPALLLVGLGLVFIYSSSSFLAAHRLEDSYFYLKRQGFFALAGLALLVVAKNIPPRVYERLTYPILFISLALLAALLVPGMGKTVGGATRWLPVGPLAVQPSEPAKLALAAYVAYSMAKKRPEMATFSRGLVPHLLVGGVFMGLIVMQPDLGTAVIIACWLLIVLFVGGVRFYQLMLIILAIAPVVGFLIFLEPYRLRRWWAFLEPWKDPQGLGFQIIHSFLAFGSGGLFGVGLGNSKQKLLFLPEPHTDFILSIIAEEVGLVGVGVIAALFGALIIRGIRVALNARDLYGTYLALGITCFLGIQVLVNMGVVMGLLPTKGLTLPLISYGGSSLIVNMVGVGMLLSISRAR